MENPSSTPLDISVVSDCYDCLIGSYELVLSACDIMLLWKKVFSVITDDWDWESHKAWKATKLQTNTFQ